MSELFDQDFLQKIQQLTLYAGFPLDGSSAGNRKSRSTGSSVEFSDYREYAPGDDFRRIDWNAYGRFDKLFVKLFMEEREAPITIFLDVSKSMDWGEPNKSISSRRLAAALGYIALSGFDRISLLCVNDTVQKLCRDVRGRNFFHKLTEMLEAAEYSGESNLQKALEGYRLQSGRGITIVISDFFSEGSFEEVLKYCKYKKQEIYICHMLSPQELKPDINDSVRLIDSETGRDLNITMTPALLNAYGKSLDSFKESLQQACFKYGAHYSLFSSGMRLEEMVKEVAVN